jgi:hypothetical protein
MDGFNFQDLTGEFSVLDVVIAMTLSFVLRTYPKIILSKIWAQAM